MAVSSAPQHTFSKANQGGIRLLVGLGVEGDAHLGRTVQHLSRKKRDPNLPNLRQVHLIGCELFDELAQAGFVVAPGQMGENITTHGIALLDLPTGARLRLGATAVVELTGLRNPCRQLDDFQPGLMAAVLDRDALGEIIRKAGTMAVVITGGEVHPGDPIRVDLPAPPYRKLEPV